MGHGASTSVRKVALMKQTDDDPRPVWTRSNSDGCIVENLNTSKTKVDLLAQQLSEYKELLSAVELKYDEADEMAKTLEKQLAEVEGTNFELSDRVCDLEQQLESIQASSGSEVNAQLEQELTLSNQQVEKLEIHVRLLEEQMSSMRSKFRKKLRAANTEVTEAKQEASLKIFRLKEEIRDLQEENMKLSERPEQAHKPAGRNGSSVDGPVPDDSRTMVILELSNQVSAQEDRITELAELVEVKERLIAELTDQLAQQWPPSRPVSEVSNRPPSGLTKRPMSDRSGKRTPAGYSKELVGDHRGGSGKSRTFQNDDSRHKNTDHMESNSETILDDSCRSWRGDEETEGRDTGTRRRPGKDSCDMNKSNDSHSGQSSSRERRRSGHRTDRGKDMSESKQRTEPCVELEAQKGSHSRKRSTSRGKQKERIPCADLGAGNGSSDICAGVMVPEDTHITHDVRLSSAGSHDSAFHENGDERSKSAPSSAGSSRHWRRLRAAQQRASSLDTLQGVDVKPLVSPRTDIVLSERDSGVEDSCSRVLNKTTKASDQELDDLLQELMSESPGGASRNNDKHDQKFGVSEDKIRSLLSDGAS